MQNMFSKNPFHKVVSEKKLGDLLDEDETKEKEANKKLMWYHGRNLTRKRTEVKLKAKDVKSGAFLVRDSFSSLGDFVLSVRVDKSKNQPEIKHYKIIKNKYDVFYTLENSKAAEIHGLECFISHFHTDPFELVTKLDKFIPHQPPPPESRRTGRTNVLHMAIAGRIEQNVLNILNHKKCPNINSKNCEGQTPLHMACEAGMKAAVDVMIQKQVKISSKNLQGLSALHVSCKYNQVDIVRLLLEKGKASPIDVCKHDRISPLHLAAQEGYIDCVKLLLSFGAPDRPRDNYANTPHELAKINNRTQVTNYLDHYTVTLPPLIRQQDWYHEYSSRQKAVELFQRLGQTDGIFLIRRSSNKTTYALTLSYEQQIYHYEIKTVEGLIFYIDDGPLLPSLEALVYHYCLYNDGLRCRLRTAVSSDESLMDLDLWFPATEADNKQDTYEEAESADDVTYDECCIGPSPNAPSHSQADNKTNTVQSNGVDPLNKFMLDSRLITVENSKELGQGEFGSVLLGIYTKPGSFKKKQKVEVAVKTLLDGALEDSKEIFLREARVMSDLEHENIVKLIGICEGPPVMIVQELVKMGSLLDYLWDNEDQIEDKDLTLWAAQIAAGMKYLEEKKIVHRDLAARNILLQSKSLAKISDFGLSRLVSCESDLYEASQGGRWPVKWYAPECINYGQFSHASDVWSYGVTLYEMYSYGEQPYGDKTGAEVILMIENGGRLPKPDQCPEHVYDLMHACWSFKPADRPTFDTLLGRFVSHPNNSRVKSIIQQKKKHKQSR